MSDVQLPSWSDVRDAIDTLGLAMTPAELHGGVSGWIAGGGSDTPDWLARVLADDSVPAVPRDSTLDAVRTASAAQLGERGFGFELLLPGAEASLTERSGALFDWCRGFLGGFGLAAGAQPQSDGDEEDEEALVEIEEFVRVAVLLLHGDCVLAPEHRKQFN